MMFAYKSVCFTVYACLYLCLRVYFYVCLCVCVCAPSIERSFGEESALP